MVGTGDQNRLWSPRRTIKSRSRWLISLVGATLLLAPALPSITLVSSGPDLTFRTNVPPASADDDEDKKK